MKNVEQIRKENRQSDLSLLIAFASLFLVPLSISIIISLF